MIHVSTPCPNLDCARALANSALKMRLAACANITPDIVSLFHWQGRIEEEHEVLLTLKTRADLRSDLVRLIERDHPYDLPVISWEQTGCTSDAAAWLSEETGGD
ncbi:MAG TPA: divalent-cation tolerance protein CutA [Roseovarius sp.]|nr:divalent-cation tolerance protein CutA [Roseovarius sp.]